MAEQMKKPKVKEVDLGDGYKLVYHKTYSWDPKVRKDYFHDWQLTKRKKMVGEFHVWFDPKNEHPYIDGVNIEEAHRRKGLGKKVYQFFVSEYGTIESAHSETSSAARKLWQSLDAIKLSDKNDNGHKRFRLSVESRYDISVSS